LSIGKAVLEVTLLTEVALVVVIFDVNFEVVGSELVDVVLLDNELAAVAWFARGNSNSVNGNA
jgi:hypothetical protein